MILHIDDSGYRLKIKEAVPTIQVMKASQLPWSSSPTGAANSNHGVVDFKDLDDEVALGCDVEGSNWRGDSIINAEQAREAVNRSPVFQCNSNSAK